MAPEDEAGAVAEDEAEDEAGAVAEDEAEAGAEAWAEDGTEDREEQSEKCVVHSRAACNCDVNLTLLLPAVAQLEKCLALFEKQAEEGRLDAHTREILCQIALKVRHPPCMPEFFHPTQGDVRAHVWDNAYCRFERLMLFSTVVAVPKPHACVVRARIFDTNHRTMSGI